MNDGPDGGVATATKQLYMNCFVPTHKVERFDMYALVTKVSRYICIGKHLYPSRQHQKKNYSNNHLAFNEQVYTYC